jgi:hypothetical protein
MPPAPGLPEALHVSPGNPRAVFYEGLVLRQQGKLVKAAEKQQQVFSSASSITAKPSGAGLYLLSATEV